MILNVEQLEDRCTPSVGWAIGPTVTYSMPEAIAAVPLPAALPQIVVPGEVWAIGPATAAPLLSGQLAGPGQYSLWHGVWGADPLTIDHGTLTAFAMPDAVTVGIGYQNGTITVYQNALQGLWSVSSTDDGMTWGNWELMASLANPPAAGPATGPVPLAYLASPEPWAGWQWGDPIPADVPATVYGTILAGPDGVRVGFEWEGQRFSGLVSGGVLTIEELDAFWMQGEWSDELEVWGV